MQTMVKLSLALLLFLGSILPVAGKAILVRNTLQEIEASKGKLELKWIKTWGGDQEEDEHKFFKCPDAMVINNENLVFITDRFTHCIKVFDKTGKYLRTIGQRGQGPSDLLAPMFIAFHPKSGLWVSELMGRRIQRFDPMGKSKAIFKTENFVPWIGVNSKNEIAVPIYRTTMVSKSLLAVRNEKWELKREIGLNYDAAKDPINREGVVFAIDSEDNFIAAYGKTPVIKKYSSEGKLVMAFTFETPYKSPYEIFLNEQGDEIKRTGEVEELTVNVNRKSSIVSIQASSKNAKRRPPICNDLATDSQNRIYITNQKRMLTDKERENLSITNTGESYLRSEVNWEELENSDFLQLLVFSPNGKIIAQVKISPYHPSLYIHGDRIFFIDGKYNQWIQEYKMIFKTGTP